MGRSRECPLPRARSTGEVLVLESGARRMRQSLHPPVSLGAFGHHTWLLWGALCPPLSTPSTKPHGNLPGGPNPVSRPLPDTRSRGASTGGSKGQSGREEGRRALPAPRGTWASLLPGNHHLRRRGWDVPAGRAGRAAGWLSGKVQPDSPRKLPRHGPAPPPGHPGSARASRGQRCSSPPLPHQRCPATLLSPRRDKRPLCGEKHPPSPFGCRKPPCCHRRGVKIECCEGMGVKNPPGHVSCLHSRHTHAVRRPGRALSPGMAQPRGGWFLPGSRCCKICPFASTAVG